MSKRLTVLLFSLLPTVTFAAGGGFPLEPVTIDLGDKAALQRGAKTYVNYCLGCHSLQYMRYNRIAQDLSLSEDLVAENLMFTADKVVEQMHIAMPEQQAERWFGVVPPDLSVIARSRGPDYLFTYLTTFYQDDDPARLFGVNNMVLANAAMPNVLWTLQGIQKPVYEEVQGADGKTHKEFQRFEVVQAGAMSEGEFKRTVSDLVNFLVYVGEPAKLHRYSIGIWVLAFIAVFFVLARALYKEYWRDVH